MRTIFILIMLVTATITAGELNSDQKIQTIMNLAVVQSEFLCQKKLICGGKPRVIRRTLNACINATVGGILRDVFDNNQLSSYSDKKFDMFKKMATCYNTTRVTCQEKDECSAVIPNEGK